MNPYISAPKNPLYFSLLYSFPRIAAFILAPVSYTHLQLLEMVPEDLKKPELTADWEMKLSGIAKGSLKRGAFMKDIRGYSQELIRQIKTGEGSFRLSLIHI